MSTQQTSSSTVADIITKARGLLNDKQPFFFEESAGETIGWVQDALLKVCRHSRGPQATESKSLLADTLEYAVTSDYVSIEAVQYINASGTRKALRRGSPAMVGRVEDPGEPVFWYDFDGKVGVFPVLSTVTTQTVTLYLIDRPEVTATTDSITTPAIYDNCLAFYVASMAKCKDRKFSAANQFMAMCERELYKERVESNTVNE